MPDPMTPPLPLPWTPDMPLRADATEEQVLARHMWIQHRWRSFPPAPIMQVAREYAAACVEDAITRKTALELMTVGRVAELEDRLDALGIPAASQRETAAPTPGSVYISGPMTGLPDFNYPAFAERAAAWRAKGWTVRNPADHFGGAQDRTYAEYMRADVADLLAVSAIAMLPGWEKSRGANLEIGLARALGLPVLDAHTFEPLEIGAAPLALPSPTITTDSGEAYRTLAAVREALTKLALGVSKWASGTTHYGEIIKWRDREYPASDSRG